MLDRVYSFSVRRHDTDNRDMVDEIKQYCIKNGIKFNFIVLAALKRFKEESIDAK